MGLMGKRVWEVLALFVLSSCWMSEGVISSNFRLLDRVIGECGMIGCG